MLRCCVSFSLAFDDFRIYRGLGFSHSLWYYLDKENINIEVYPFVFSTVELLLYIAQYRRVKYKKPSWFSVLYFSVMAGIHLLVWLYASQLNLPSVPVQNEAEEVLLLFFRFVKLSLIQPFLYLTVYLLRMLLAEKTRTGDGSVSRIDPKD